ncbi:MAG: N-acetylneuraminate synthase family protein [Rikenellaceae bacterium]
MKIIAESAFNHNGNMQYLKELATESKGAGCDYFTVQIMNPDRFCEKNYDKYDIYHNNYFKPNEWIELFDYCKLIELELLPCVLDDNSFELCYNYGFRYIKIHSTDITNINLLALISQHKDCRLVLESQCATYQDLELAFSIVGTQVEVLFHGFSNYPTDIEDSNLDVIESLRRDFPNCKYGFADHTLTTVEMPLMIMAKGYDYIEKHITLTRSNRHFDWQVSLYPLEFKMMVNNIKHYALALGKSVKHPSINELQYRDVIFKKSIDNGADFLRSNNSADYLTHEFGQYSNKNVGIGIIARLKSQRLKQKVLLPLHNYPSMIEALFDRMQSCNNVNVIKLATSNISEDDKLAKVFSEDKVFRGHAISVIDRLLSFARKYQLGAVIRVTGDNPMTDPSMIDRMVELYQENDLDYVRSNNVPFGTSAELFSVKYLWNLYLNMDNPLNSEYLSWFVLNDPSAQKGCIDFCPFDKRVSLVNLSIDYLADYKRVENLIDRIGKDEITTITFDDIIKNIDLEDIMDDNKIVKLPENTSIIFKDYLELMNSIEYKVKLRIDG